jgi:hypothetical protein
VNSVAEAILAEARGYSVSRSVAGTRSKGVYTPGARSSVAVTMAVQPMTARELQVQPEGLRERQLLKCYATSELRPASQTGGTDGDRFTYRGATYEVTSVSDWSDEGGFWRAVAARVQE